MKHTKRTYLVILAVFALVLSACGGAPAAAPVPSDQASIKVSASLIAYTGTVESIDGDQWVVNGQTLTVDPAVIQDNHTYTLSVRIEDSSGKLLFINTTSYPVITNDNPTSGVEVVVEPVG